MPKAGAFYKRVTVFILFAVLLHCAFYASQVDLPEVLAPASIHVYGGRMFIAEAAAIHIYSLKDFKQIKQFGRQGTGPGEFFRDTRLTVFPERLVVNTFGKLIFFSHDGLLMEEHKKAVEIMWIYPVGDCFVGSEFVPRVQKINIYDGNFHRVKNIFEGSIGWVSYFESGTAKQDLIMVKDYAAPHVYKDKIYIFDSSKGFFFAVFDSSGKKIFEKNIEYKPPKVSADYKKERLRRLEESPWFKSSKDRFNPVFPDFFPPYRSVRISDDRIYFVTYLNIDNKDEVVVTDLEGNLIKKTYIPATLYDKYIFTISGNKVYSLIEDDKEELWQLLIGDL